MTDSRNDVSLFNSRHLAFTFGYFLLINGALLLFFLLLTWVEWAWMGQLSFRSLWSSLYFFAATLGGLGLGHSYQLGLVHGLRSQMKGISSRAWSTAVLHLGASRHYGRLWVAEDTLHFQGDGQTLRLPLDEIEEVEMSGWLQPRLRWHTRGQHYQLDVPDARGWRRVLTEPRVARARSGVEGTAPRARAGLA